MRLLFLITITLGSGLLFLVQPLCARMVLPLLGGAPAVWTACMLFFQAGLLAGYAYAHLLPQWLGDGRMKMVHALLLLFCLLLLPIHLPNNTPLGWPVPWLLGTLLITVGLPFLLLASNAPLLQRWYAQSRPGRDPYFLYAASNLGSFAGLLAYPFLFEPLLDLPDQADFWSLGYVGFASLILPCAFLSLQKKDALGEPRGSSPMVPLTELNPDIPLVGPIPGPWKPVRWVLLALVPSSLMLSVTTYLTSDIAPLPLFWIVPLGIYLLTFVAAFSRPAWLSRRQLVRWAPLGVVLVALLFMLEGNDPIWLVFTLHLANFTLLAAFCHGELSRTRPPAEQLTGFYFWLALGGVLGGLLNGLIAPLLFPMNLEYPLILVLVLCLLPRKQDLAAAHIPPPWRTVARSDLAWASLIGLGTLGLVLAGRFLDIPPSPLSVGLFLAPGLLASYLLQDRPTRLALCLGGVFLASSFQPGVQGKVVYLGRSFFGVHRVTEKDGKRILSHGTTLHGSQFLNPDLRDVPLNYYSREGPAGILLNRLQDQDDPRMAKVGLVGLGTGSLASYARAGQHWTFFEIDPVVIDISRDRGLFSYLSDAQENGALIDVRLGDARLTLRASPDLFGLLILDAFSSDAIPVHLLTREALLEFRDRARDDGFLLLHISNRYLDLAPVLANLAGDLGWHCRLREGRESTWAALSWGDPDELKKLLGPFWGRPDPDPKVGIWRDTHVNLLPLIDWLGKEREPRQLRP